MCPNGSTCGLLFRWASNYKIHLSVLVQYKADIIINSLNITCSRHDIAENCSFGVKQQPLTHSIWIVILYSTGVVVSVHIVILYFTGVVLSIKVVILYFPGVALSIKVLTLYHTGNTTTTERVTILYID
jgi:hypothetical protein